MCASSSRGSRVSQKIVEKLVQGDAKVLSFIRNGFDGDLFDRGVEEVSIRCKLVFRHR